MGSVGRPPSDRSLASSVVVVGIAGGSGSGKSTLARSLVAEFGPDRAVVVSFDDYYRDLAHLPEAERAATNFDHPDALDETLFAAHLDALRAGRPVDVPVYDFATHSRRPEVVRVEPRPIVIAEGILLLASPPVAARLDVAVYVEAAQEVRLARRIARDRVERGRSEESVRAQFAATVGPMHDRFVAPSRDRAVRVVSGEAALEVSVAAVVGLVNEALSTGLQDP